MQEIKPIDSFTVDHRKLLPGIYISRRDKNIITYDLRTRKPNAGDYMSNITMHTVEHMLATYLRNSDISANIVYFGPMGCQTGFYLLVADESPQTVLAALKNALALTVAHNGEVFGQSEEACGNYRNLDLDAARIECRRYLDILNAREQSFCYES